MQSTPLKLHPWPQCPDRLQPGELALFILTLPADTVRANARLIARDALRHIASKVSGVKADNVFLVEGSRGPILTGLPCHLEVSLSYAHDKVVLGFSCGRALGVDIVHIKHLPESKALCALYLPDAAALAVTGAPDEQKGTRFALAWAQMEACCKALNLPLAEIDQTRAMDYAACELIDCEQIEGYGIAVAIPPKNPVQV